MPGMTRRPEPSRIPRLASVRANQDGFMMIEVIVSAVLLIVLSLATLKLIDGSTNVSAQQRSKAIAANLAENDLDRMRQMKFASSSNFSTRSFPRGVDNRTYTVVSTGTWTSDEGTFASCTTSTVGNPGQYIRVTSTVTWSGMTVAPVTAATLITPRPGETSITTGAFMVKIQSAAGLPVANATISMGGRSLITGAAGCALFTGLAPGTYPVTYSAPGMITPDQATPSPGSYSAVVTKGNTSSKVVLLDVPAKVTPITFKREDGTASAWTSYSMRSGTDYANKWTFPSAGSYASTAQVFPFLAGYQVWAGDCAGNNPSTYNGSFFTNFPQAAVATPAGSAPAATAYLRTATLTVKNVPKSSVVNVYFKADTPGTAAMLNCAAGRTTAATFTNGSTAVAASQNLSIDLPYGTYDWCVDASKPALGNYKNTAANVYSNTPTGGAPAPTTSLQVDVSNPTGGACPATW
jgi:Tfp pilus assembly protein PilV